MVLYGDGPLMRAETLRRLMEAESRASPTGVLLSAEMADPTGYGRVIRDSRGYVREVVEQKAGTSGTTRHSLKPTWGSTATAPDLFWKHVDEIQPDNPPSEYYLTDMVAHSQPRRPSRGGACAWTTRRSPGNQRPRGTGQVDRILRERKRARTDGGGRDHRKARDRSIDAGVRIGMDTVIGPFAQILGGTAIGENCRIGACSIVQDSELADEVEIGPFTIVNTSRLERGAPPAPSRACAETITWRPGRTSATSWS